MMPTEIIQQTEQLSVTEKWQLVKQLLRSLEQNQAKKTDQSDWHELLLETYGILADDPIERPPQCHYEEI